MMYIASQDCARGHRIDFAQRFSRNAELHGVFMGFFDCATKRFSDSWVACNPDCSQETLRNLVRMAETRLVALADSEARRDQSRPNLAHPEEPRDKHYPIWISNGRNVVGIGAPIQQCFPVMAFPRLGHSDVLEKQSVLRIGMAYVSQQLAEAIDCHNDWPMAALEAVISFLALQVFVVNSIGQVVYQQGRGGPEDPVADRPGVGEAFALTNPRESVAVRDAIRAVQGGGKPSLLSVTCLGNEARLALVAPLEHPEGRMAIVVLGQHRANHDLQYRFFFDAYEMTPSERLVAREVLQGRQLNDIASSTGLSLSTIRSYLKQIFAKTRTHRQIDLVLLYYQAFPGAARSL